MSEDELQSRVASVVDLDQNTSNLDSDDQALRRQYMNRSLTEWAEAHNWKQLFAEYNMRISTSSGNASVVMPNDFRKLAGYVKITHDGSTTDLFSDVRPEDDNQYVDTDKRVLVLGSPNGGYVLRVLGATLTSGASVKVPYYRSAASLATTTSIADVPNPEYIVQRTVAYVWEARGDERFPLAKAEAEKILANMIEYENVFPRGADYDHVKSVEQTRYNFRIGRN